MNIQEQIKNQQLRKKLEAKKQERIKKKLAARQREKVNIDQSHLKTGKMEKTKIIEKKKYKTEVQKSRKIAHEIQDNANPGTYVGQSQEYIKVLQRTRNYVKFDKNMLETGCKAISAYAEAHRQKNIDIIITMQKPIECNECPILLRLPYPQKSTKCIIIRKQGQKIEQKLLPQSDIHIMTSSEFSTKLKQDKQLKKQINKKQTRILCNFDIFSKSKMLQKLIQKQIPIFPIDINKVPYALSTQFSTYQQYLKFLVQAVYFVARSGTEFIVRLRWREDGELATNIESVVHQAVAKLIVKTKVKGNRLLGVKVKSQSSIPIDIYKSN